MTDKAKAMVMASFAADALALGPHWIYDQASLQRAFGRVDSLRAPREGSQHHGKPAGALTHYGDQTLVLLDSVAATRGFDLPDFAARWQKLMADYQGYLDQATKGTLRGFSRGETPLKAGSKSRDLAGASRIAPVIYAHRAEPDLAVQAARSQTAMTHNNPEVIEAAELFARTALAVLGGAGPVEALEGAATAGYSSLPARQWLDKGLALASKETDRALKELGLSCHVDEAFPGTVQIIARHENDLQEGLIACVMAGGDSAARGMLAGLILGAGLGLEAVPAEWVQGLQERQRIEGALQAIEAG